MLNIKDFVNAIHKEFEPNITIENAVEKYKDFLIRRSDFTRLNFDYILQNFDAEPLLNKESIESLSPKRHYHYLHLFRSVNKNFDKDLLRAVFDKELEEHEEFDLLKILPIKSYSNAFPMEEMRNVQKQIFDKIDHYLKDPNITDIIIDAPTGCGKSGVSVACLLKEYSGYIVTANKALQNQYASEFPWLSDLRGKANYNCRVNKGYNCKSSPCQNSSESRSACKENGGCDYGATKRRVLQHSSYSLMNMHTLIAYAVYVTDALSKRDILVIDEAHSLPEVITSSVGLSLQLKKLITLGINNIPEFNTPESYASWLSGVLKVLNKEEDLDEEDGQLVHKIEVIIGQLGSGNIALDFEYDKDNKSIITTLKLHPIRVEEYYEKIRQVAPLRIHLSATILGYSTYCSMLGIKEENVAIIRAGSPFPKEIRPIYLSHAVGSINMNSLNYVMPKIITNIESLMDYYEDYKGIIHGVTYNICNNIYSGLSSKHKSRILFPRMAREQSEMMNEHRTSKNTILLSPSMTEGVDLKGPLSRFQILVKTPYPYLGDPILKKRRELYSGYYEMLTATAIMQAYGRSVRSTDDWAFTFVLDNNFKNFINSNSGLFPKWFLDAVH